AVCRWPRPLVAGQWHGPGALSINPAGFGRVAALRAGAVGVQRAHSQRTGLSAANPGADAAGAFAGICRALCLSAAGDPRTGARMSAWAHHDIAGEWRAGARGGAEPGSGLFAADDLRQPADDRRHPRAAETTRSAAQPDAPPRAGGGGKLLVEAPAGKRAW